MVQANSTSSSVAKKNLKVIASSQGYLIDILSEIRIIFIYS
jgi:hypothetical protein